MQQPKEKLPKTILIAPLALILCCFGPAIFLFFSTGAAVSFLAHNKIGIYVFLVLLIILTFLIFKYGHDKKSQGNSRDE